MEQLAVDIREAARLTSLSPFTIRAYIRKGTIRSVRVGRRILVPVEVLRELCERGLPTHPSPNPLGEENES